MPKLYQDREWMLTQFAIPGKTIAQVALDANVNEKTIRRWQKRLRVASHSIAEQAWYRQSQHTLLSQTALEIIDGSLLGDGNLTSESQWSAIYQQTSSNLAFVTFVRQALEEQEVKCGDIITRQNSGYGKLSQSSYTVHSLHSLSHTGFKPIYDKWYGKGKKVVPPDLVLTPLISLYWYLGDGCYCKGNAKGYKPYMRIATDGFHLNEVKFLASQLFQFDPRINRMSSHKKDGYGYRICMKSSFLDWIGECPEILKDSYGYKWGPEYDRRKPK